MTSVRTFTSRFQSRRRSSMLRRVVVLGGVGLAVFAVLFASSPTAKGYTITATTTDYVTTTGGGGYVGPEFCPTGSVIYQMGATGDNGNTSLTRPVGGCVSLNGAASAHNTVTSSIAPSNWGGAGTTGLTPVRCTTAQAVVGLVVHKQSNGYASGWQLICGTLPTGGSRTTDSAVLGWSNAGTSSPTQRETIQCPTGMVAVGMVAYVGGIMDRIGFRCGTISAADQATVSVTSSSSITFGSTLALTATGGTGSGAMSFTTTGSCTVSGSTLTPTGNAGATCSVTATRASDTNYASQASVAQTVTIQRAANTIAFTNPTTRTWSATPFNVTVSATSGITPSVTSTTTSVCSVSGIAVTMLSSGTCSLTATQGETTNHVAAVAVSHNFTINPTGRSAFTGNSASISATTTGTKYVVERFTTSGASTWSVPQGVTSIDYLVVGGGGGGGAHVGGGGGAGGVRTGSLAVTPGASVSLTIGAGGAGSIGGSYGDCSATNRSKSGNNSTLSTITAAGGGGGGNWNYCAALSGGSGGGGGTTDNAGLGNTPSTSPSQGNNGGGGSGSIGGNYTGGGGGGAGSVGAAGPSNAGGNGGTGVQSGITGVMSYYGGGGGGGVHSPDGNGSPAVAGTGGLGGGGNGNVSVQNGTAGSGQANTGGGGGGAGYPSGTLGSSTGGAGGSGIVVVRYVLPAVTTPNLIDADDTGTNSDNITSKRTLIFTGSAPVTASVQLSVATATSSTDTDATTGTWTNTGSACTANATSGAWSCTTAQLAPGLYKVRSTATTTMDGITDTQTSSTALVVDIDTTAPTIALTRSGTGSLTAGQTETITFTLSEASSTFAADDITFSGGTISALTTTSSTVYSVVFTPTANTQSGTASISVALSRFTDTAGNNNTASDALAIAYDTSRPSVTMSASPASVSSGSTSTITFTVSESVTTFTSADVSARLGTLTNFSGSGTSYTATFTASPTTGGTAVITVASGSITDSNTNANTSAFTFEITVTNTATSSGGRTSYVGNGSNGTNSVRYIVERFTTTGTTTWTVPRGISSIDYLVVGGGAGGGSRHAGGGGAGGLRSSVSSTGGGASPESAMSVTPGGSLTVTVGAGGASWANGSNSVLGSVTSLGGGTQATSGGSGGGMNYNDAGASGTANQGFNGGRGGGSVGEPNWLYAGGGGGGAGAAGSNVGYSGGTAFGGAGGAGVTNSISGVAVCFAGGGGGGYSNNATNGGADNFTIQGGKCGSTMVGGTSPRGANATAGATNTGSGGGGGGFDGGAGNYSGGAGGSGIVVVRYAVPDVTTPDLDASDDTGTNTDNITSATTLSFTGSAPVGSTVQLFVDGVSSGNTCATNSTTGAWTCDTATLAAGNKVITAQSTTLLPDSTVTSTSSGLNVTIDTTAPTIQVTRSGSGALTAGQTETITFTLSEASSTFAADDITLSGGTISALTTTSSTVYSVLFTPTANTQSGTASISVALSRFTDAAGNNNTVSNTVSFTYDTSRPTVSLSGCSLSYAAGSSCSITITLSDAVTDLLLADFNVTRGSLSGLTTSGTSRTVTYTAAGPTGGTASISLAAGAFTDANGNTSTASNTLSVAIAASNTRQMMTSLSASGVSVADNTNGASRYIVQTFAATGSTTWIPPQGVTRVDLLVIGGGGGAGSRGAGGGGAGAYIEASNYAVTPGSSYSVVTGAGGAGAADSTQDSGLAGSSSSFTLSGNGLTANGGGAGLSHGSNGNGGASGTGSGTGGTAYNNIGGNGAANGSCGATSDWCGGGGGGASTAGVTAVSGGGNGGNGRSSSITGISTIYAGGGGGGGGDSSQPSTSPSPGGTGGSGGGGNGGSPTWDGTNCRAGAGISGKTNTGGGGGGGSYCSSNVVGSFNGGGGSGGSGIVVVRYVLPATSTPDLAVGSDNGTSTTDNLTSNRTLTFDGSAPATASVQLSVATATSATDTDISTGTWTDTGSACTADTTSGAWTCTTAELAPGLYKVRSKATTTMDGITDTQTSSTALVVEIDTTAPTVSSVSFTSSSGSDGTYKSGDVISVTVAFSENVAVTNSPRVALAGLSSKFATYASGSGTTSLVFTYTVASGDNDADGLAITADSLELNSGTIRDTAANNATLAHSAVSTASTQKVDTTAPTVTIARSGSGSMKSGQTDTITFTLSEASSDFVVGDITVAGGSIGTLTTTSSTEYSVVFTPTANTQSGTGSLSVSGTKFTDTAGNNNTASTALSITYDTAGPTISIARSGSGLLKSGQTDTITFTLSEASSTFAADDITVAGGSIGTLTTTSSTVYSVVFTPTTNTQTGAGSISVAGATFVDTLGNDNTASSTLNISYDTAAPTVTITRAGSTTLRSSQTETVTFTLSEASSTFAADDITFSGGTIGTLTTTSSTVYSVVFTPTTNTQSGNGSISIDGAKFTDTIGNDNTASTALSISYDTLAPTVSLTRSGSGTLNSTQTSTITFTLSEASSTFAADDITVSGGTISALTTTSSTVYSVVFTPTTNTQSGTGSISVAGAKFTDALGNDNTASTALSISYDTAAPTVTITRAGSVLRSGITEQITFTLSEASSTFSADDITVAGGTIGGLTTPSSTVYYGQFTPTTNTQSGTGSISVAGTTFTDAAGNTNTASATTSFAYDTLAPTVSLVRTGSGTLKAGQTDTITVTFSEIGSFNGFTSSGGTLSNYRYISPNVYAINFTPTSSMQTGSGSVSVLAGDFIDDVGNANAASNVISITYDTLAPTATVSRSYSLPIGARQNNTITFTLSEASSTFTAADITVTGGSIGSLTTVSSTVYRVLFTPTADTESGTATLSIDGAKFTDSAGNDNTASNILSIPFDTREPTVAITRAGSTTLRSGQTDIITFTLSEASSTFTAADITVSGGSIGALTTTSSTVYSVVFTPTTNTQSGTGSISVAATRFTDATGNGNIASSTRSVPYDTLAASVSNVTSSTANGTIGIGSPVSIQIVFSEAVTVSGTPQLTLETGATDRVASYTSGGGTDTLTLTYTVQSGDTSSDLEYTSTSALALNGGTIVDSVGNAATLALPTPGATGSLAINSAIVVASAPTQVVSVRTPLGPASGAAFTQQPRVSLQDTGGSVVTSDSSTVVTATVSSGASLVGSVTATAVNGVVTFNDLGITGTAGTAYTITYSATVSGNALTAATQSVTPTVGVATQISVSTQPVGDTAGALLATAPVVSVLDSGNNMVTSASTSITVSSSGGTLNGTKTVSATNGLATFGDLTFAGTAGTNYTLTFTTTSLGSAQSNNFSVGVGAATKLAITTQASGAAYNEAFTTQPVIEIRDAGNNKVPSAANVVTATLSNGTVLGSNNTSLNATSSSGVATFSGLGITGLPGSYTITYSSGSLADTSHSISLVKAAQTITFADPTDRAWSATSFALTPTASSGLSVSLASTTTSICTVSGLDVTMVTVGTCSLTATQSGNDYFNAATAVSHGFDIPQASQTVSFSDPADRPWSATTFDVAPTATSGLSTTVASTTSTVCTVSGTTITMVKAGTCTLTASQAGNTEYSAATTQTQSFVIELATQSTFSLTSTTATFGANLTLTTTGGSGSGSVTFTKVSGDCSITNTTLTPTSASTCVVTATKAADSQYDSTSDTQTITINRAAQSTPLTLATTTVVYGQTLTLSGSGGEGTGTISYAVSSGTCTLNGAVLTPGNAGSLCEVEVTRALSTNYNSFTSAPISITIQQATPTLGTLVLATKTYGDAPFAFTASSSTYNSASVAGSWSYASAQTSVATINGGTATITGGGTSAITATFSPTDSTNYTTATTTSTLTVDKAVPTFSWSNVDATYNDADITIVSPAVATTAATGTWTYSSADTSVVAISGTKFDVGNAGSAVITATFTPSNTTNYVSGETTTMTFTVGRANQASLGISSVTGTYGTALTLATSGGTTNGSITWGVSNGSASDCSVTSGQLTTTSIGTCTVTAVMADSSNYFSVSNVGTTVTINAKPITVTATAKFKTYGDNDPALTFTTPNGALVGNDTLAGSLTRVAGVDVGEYTINQGTVTNTNNTNYNITYVTAKLTINAKPITVTAEPKNKIYGQNDPALTFTTADGALVGNDTLTGSLTRDSGNTVGEYTINQGSVDNSNYDISYTSAKLTINTKPITVTAEAKFKTYGDNDPALTFTTVAGALVGNDALTGALSRVAGDTVGEYTITRGSVANTNYDITYTSAKLIINAKPITITATAKFKTYGDNDPALTFTTPNGALVGNDTLTGSLTRDAGNTVGEYTINQGTVTNTNNTNNTNYDISYTSAKLTINAKPITVTATAKFKTYGDNDPALTFTTATGALVGNDTLAGALTRVLGQDVGEYTINQGTVTNSNNTNYDLTYVTAKITINEKPITVTAEPKFKTYGDNDPALTFTTATGALVGNDTLAGALTRVLGQDVGEYTIIQGSVDNSNYDISYTSAKLTINAKPITVTAEAKFKTYGDNDPALTFTTPNGALVGNDSLAGSLTRVTGQDIGEYTINQGTVTNTSNTNYDITYTSAKLTINAKPITVTAEPKTKIYNTNDPVLTYTTPMGALVDNDTLAGAIARVSGEQVASYPIRIGTLNNPNYLITFVDSALSITPAQQSQLTVTTATITYQTPVSLQATGGTEGDLSFSVVTSGSAGCSIQNSQLSASGNAGSTCTVKATRAATTNFSQIDSATATITVTRRAITVTGTAEEKIYGDADPGFRFSVTAGSLHGSESLTGSLVRATGENAGTYTINQGSLIDTNNPNYTITYVSSQLTVIPRPITITATNKTKIFGQPDPALEYTVTTGNIVPSDVIAGEITRAVGETLGNYNITRGTLVNNNYNITFVTGIFQITGAPQAGFTLTASSNSVVYQQTITVQTSGGNGQGAVSYSTQNGTGSCSVAGTTVTGTTTGTCTVTATKAAEGGYLEAISNSITVTIEKADQTITFASITDHNYSPTPMAMTPTASSGAAVSIGTRTPNVCSTENLAVQMLDSGMCTIAAEVASSRNFNAAPTVTRSFEIRAVAPFAPTITAVEPGDTTVSVVFTPGLSGGAAITTYRYSVDDGGRWTDLPSGTTSSPIILGNLPNTVEAKVRIMAVNRVGNGARSNMRAATPVAKRSLEWEVQRNTVSGTQSPNSATTVQQASQLPPAPARVTVQSMSGGRRTQVTAVRAAKDANIPVTYALISVRTRTNKLLARIKVLVDPTNPTTSVSVPYASSRVRVSVQFANDMGISSGGPAGINIAEGNTLEWTTVSNEARIKGAEVKGDLVFERGKSTLTYAMQQNLKKMAATVNARGGLIYVSGFAQKGELKSAWMLEPLARARAEAVAKYLAKIGVRQWITFHGSTSAAMKGWQPVTGRQVVITTVMPNEI